MDFANNLATEGKQVSSKFVQRSESRSTVKPGCLPAGSPVFLRACRSEPHQQQLSTVNAITVLFEDNHLLVVDKPADLPTMGATDEPTLHSLAAQYVKTKYNKPGNVYIGIVSRLDRMTTGVIVLARTSKAAARLTKQFATTSADRKTPKTDQANKVVRKIYFALVPTIGCRPSSPELSLGNEGRWTDMVYKDDSAKRMRVAQNMRANAKEATLTYQVVATHGELSLVAVTPITGRKHQIRVQFSSRGTPVCGDRKYASDHSWPAGIALHSAQLRIEHPTLKTPLVFESPLPASWPNHWTTAATDWLAQPYAPTGDS